MYIISKHHYRTKHFQTKKIKETQKVEQEVANEKVSRIIGTFYLLTKNWIFWFQIYYFQLYIYHLCDCKSFPIAMYHKYKFGCNVAKLNTYLDREVSFHGLIKVRNVVHPIHGLPHIYDHVLSPGVWPPHHWSCTKTKCSQNKRKQILFVIYLWYDFKSF